MFFLYEFLHHMTRRFLRPAAVLAACVLLSMLSGCSSKEPAGTRVTVSDFRYVQLPDGERQFMGRLHNKTKQTIPYAQIDVALYNRSGVQVGRRKIAVEKIPANGSAPFKRSVSTDASVDGARVESVLIP